VPRPYEVCLFVEEQLNEIIIGQYIFIHNKCGFFTYIENGDFITVTGMYWMPLPKLPNKEV
jgi:hypothetical protein